MSFKHGVRNSIIRVGGMEEHMLGEFFIAVTFFAIVAFSCTIGSYAATSMVDSPSEVQSLMDSLFTFKIIMASKAEPVNEQAVANMYAAMRSELNQIYSKITELEMEVSEHTLVINAIQPLDQTRRCYRMIGGVLVERTIKEVLPAVQRNKEGLEEVVARLNEALEKKKKEITEFEAKYKIRIRKADAEVKDESGRKEGSAQGVLFSQVEKMKQGRSYLKNK
ncbi:putative prefoldin subunit 2, partial [Mucuna pruriens]